jgi:site-specific recombinase XerD
VVVLLCKRVSRRIGRRLHPHLFRHTFATELLNRRADEWSLTERTRRD